MSLSTSPRVAPAGARGTLRTLCASLLLVTAPAALAAWDLDTQRSTVQFMSVKNSSVAELHFFRTISGGIGDAGSAQLTIDLDSVETLIPIRNERLRELLFETVQFPAATLSAQVPEALLAVETGQSVNATIDLSLELHGASKSYPAAVLVTRLADASLQVVLREPLLVNADDFGLAAGVGVLREVAGLQSISTAIPVTATLVFVAAP